jgi:hypothetical protein
MSYDTRSYDLGTSTDTSTPTWNASHAHNHNHNHSGHMKDANSEYKTVELDATTTNNNNQTSIHYGTHNTISNTSSNNNGTHDDNGNVIDGTDSGVDVATEYPSSYTIPNARSIADTSPLPIGFIMNPCVKYDTPFVIAILFALHLL